jgi:hypothetical protein
MKISVLILFLTSIWCCEANECWSFDKDINRFEFWNETIPRGYYDLFTEIVVTNGNAKFQCIVSNYFEDFLIGRTYLYMLDIPNSSFSYLGTHFTARVSDCVLVLINTNAVFKIHIKGNVCIVPINPPPVNPPVSPPIDPPVQHYPPSYIVNPPEEYIICHETFLCWRAWLVLLAVMILLGSGIVGIVLFCSRCIRSCHKRTATAYNTLQTETLIEGQDDQNL